jgi:hypothetical protein
MKSMNVNAQKETNGGGTFRCGKCGRVFTYNWFDAVWVAMAYNAHISVCPGTSLNRW